MNSFIEVFEDNSTLASRFKGDTQAYLEGNAKESSESHDIVNVKIEAPVIFMPEGQRFWIADLGTFDISRADTNTGQASVLTLEGKNARVYFAEEDMGLHNLNQLVVAPNLVSDLLPKFSLVVSDLEFAIEIGKTEVTKEEVPSIVDNLIFTVRPFKIDLVDNSLKSLLTLALTLSEETRQEKAFIDKVMKTGEVVSNLHEIEYDIGYEVWEECDVVLEGQSIHIISHQNKVLTSQNFATLASIGLDQKGSVWVLCLTFKRKKVVLRSSNRVCLAELKFKIGSILSIIESDEQRERLSQTKSFDSDYVMSLKFTEVSLTVQKYYRNTTPFAINMKGMLFSSENIGGVEVGNFQFADCLVSDFSDNCEILKLETEKGVTSPGMYYSYIYKEGSLASNITLSSIELTYKVQYVQSLIRLSEIVVEYLAEGQKVRDDRSPKRILSQDASILDEPIIRKSTTKQQIQLTCRSAKINIYYKKDIKSVCMRSQGIHLDMDSQGLNSNLILQISQIHIGSYLPYPYRPGSDSLVETVPMVYQRNSGSITLTIKTREIDARKRLSSSELDCQINDLVVDWIQQPMLRFFDFLNYQVLEIFYPSLLSFSKFYNKENIIKQALKDLNDSEYLKQTYSLTNCWVQLPSTIESGRKVRLTVESGSVVNKRGYFHTIANKDQVDSFPFEELESDLWDIGLMSVGVCLVTPEDEVGRICIKEPVDLRVSVNYIAKLFELSFLYDIEDDVLSFDSDTRNRLERLQALNEPLKEKKSLSLGELRNQASKFIRRESSKEKLLIDGRFHVSVEIQKMELYLTNQFVNIMTEILGNNITFEDGQDTFLTNQYETTEKVV